MYDTRMTVVGNLVNAVDLSRLPDGTAVANFRVASTQRRRDRATGVWVDGDSLYLDVTCWRELAENVDASLVKGDPVVVSGRFYTRSYEHEGQRRSTTTLEAHSVGPDLARSRAAVTRTRRGGSAPEGGEGGEGTAPPRDTGTRPAQVDGDPATAAPRLVAVAPAGEG